MPLVHTRFEIFETFVRFIRTIFSQVNYSEEPKIVNFINDSSKIVRVVHISGLNSCQAFCIISYYFRKL